MAKIRVHELAKEYGMTGKEMLQHLADMKIPAKSHASILSDSNVDAIRKALAPELAQAQVKVAGVDDEMVAAAKAAMQEAEAKKAEEERERREAVERERALRDAERARRNKSEGATEVTAPRPAASKRPAPAPVQSNSGLASLAQQIEEQRLAEEQRKARAAAEKLQAQRAAEVAKKRAVQEQLQANRAGKRKAAPAEAPVAKPAPKPWGWSKR